MWKVKEMRVVEVEEIRGREIGTMGPGELEVLTGGEVVENKRR